MSIKHTLLLFCLLCTPIIHAAELLNFNPSTLQANKDQALIIDIRTPAEWQQTGLIPGSHALTFFDARGQYDVQQWLAAVKRLQSSPNQALILVCQSGRRSARAGELVAEQLTQQTVGHLQQGMHSWLQEQRPTITATCSTTQSC